MRISEQHREAIDPNALARGGRHAVRESANVIHVHFARRFLASAFDLRAETAFLFDGIVQLGESIAEFHPGDIDLETLDERGIVLAAFGQRRNIRREIVQES